MKASKCEKCGEFFEPSDDVVVVLSGTHGEELLEKPWEMTVTYLFHKPCFNEVCSNDFGLSILPSREVEP